MADVRQLVMVAGPNGSGKSTLIAALRADAATQLPALYINADDLQRERGLSDGQAQALAAAQRLQALQAGESLMFETVMSHPSKLAELQQAKATGYHIIIHLVATEHPDINTERVGVRVGAGGHDVPRDRIATRYQRTLALAPLAIAYADQAVVFDNTHPGDTGRGLQAQAAMDRGRLVSLVEAPAQWVQRLIGRVNGRAQEVQALVHGTHARGLPPQLARLDGGSTEGPVIAVGKHYLLQYDGPSQTAVLHDRVLLGPLADHLAVHDVRRFAYRDGVAAQEPLQVTRIR